jgi:hypothetical protein
MRLLLLMPDIRRLGKVHEPPEAWQNRGMLNTEESREVRLQIRTVLMSKWDPIGVNEVPKAADEYDSYIGGVYELLERGASEESIRAYLRNIEIELWKW